jgi:DNA-binding transcriptional MerR regulator
LLLILRGKRLGFSLAEIKEFLDLYDADPTQREQFLLLLKGVRKRVGELERQRRDLELTLEELREVERETLDAMEERGFTEKDSQPEPEPDR